MRDLRSEIKEERMERVTRLLEMRSNKMNANSDIDEFDRSTRYRYALSYTERRMF